MSLPKRLRIFALFIAWISIVAGLGILLFVRDPVLAFLLRIDRDQSEALGDARVGGRVERQYSGEFLFQRVEGEIRIFDGDRFATSETGTMTVVFDRGLRLRVGSKTWWTVSAGIQGEVLYLEKGEFEIDARGVTQDTVVRLPSGKQLSLAPQGRVRLRDGEFWVVDGEAQVEGETHRPRSLSAVSPYGDEIDLSAGVVEFKWSSPSTDVELEVSEDPSFQRPLFVRAIRDSTSWQETVESFSKSGQKIWWRVRSSNAVSESAWFTLKRPQVPILLSPTSRQFVPLTERARVHFVWEGDPSRMYRLSIEGVSGTQEHSIRGTSTDIEFTQPGIYRWSVEGEARSDIFEFTLVRDQTLPPPQKIHQPRVRRE